VARRTISRMMPAAFIGHGNPMNALDHNRYTEAWRAFGAAVPTPRAIVVISAHWYINASAVTAMAAPRTIHDFYGFPKPLFDFQYPAPGAPDLVAEIADAAKPTWIGADDDSWGLDHGTWSVLTHVFPGADVPVVQLAINATMPLAYHFELGRQLAPLRDTGILLIGSGNIVHNLGMIDFGAGETGERWAHRFDEAVHESLTVDPQSVLGMERHHDFDLAVPTPDHYIPMLYLAGLAAAAGEPAEVFNEGYFGGSLSMTSYTVGLHAPAEDDDLPGSPPLPDVPADETNI
jgi:4,5-DOPA dioxygenase extradiol